MNPNTIRASLRSAELPRLELHMLWQHVLGCSRAWLTAHDTDPLDPEALAQFQCLLTRRLQGEPMAYLLGRREFMGHDFLVSPAVLIPRPETEGLVAVTLEATERIRQLRGSHAVHVLELGTGSGAIAISLALADPTLCISATDISAQALDIAQHNAQRLGVKIAWALGQWYDAHLCQAPYDVIVSNPPYIAHDDTHLSQGDLRFEPLCALTDGADGLQDLATIIAGAHAYLRAGGELWLEHGWDQGYAVRDGLSQAGFKDVRSINDLAGLERISGACYLG